MYDIIYMWNLKKQQTSEYNKKGAGSGARVTEVVGEMEGQITGCKID